MPYSEVPSENTDLLNAILNDETYYSEVSSRNAEILKSIANGTTYTAAPQSYIEELLLDLKEKIEDQPTVEALSVTENGTYSETGKAYSPVTVNVPGAPTLGTKTITANGTYNAVDDSLDGYSSVTVDVDGYTIVDDTTPAPIKTLTTAPYPMGACKVGIEAVQNLNGYSKPWVGGAGKNKLPLDLDTIKSLNTGGTWSGNVYTLNDVTFTVETNDGGNVTGIKVNGTSSANTSFILYRNLALNGTYSINGWNTNATYNANAFLRAYSATQSYYISSNTNTADASGTFESATDVMVWINLPSDYAVSNLTFYPMIRLSTETDATFELYSNICPITGWDEVNLYKTNKNILPNKYYQVNSTTLALGTETADTFPIYLEANTNYVLSFDTNKTAVVLSEKCEDETSATTHTYTNGMFNITSRNAGYYSFTLTNSSAITSSDFLNVMLEKGTAKTSYEAYSGTTYTENLATTNYGGYWDAVEGEVGSTHANIASYNGETLPGAWISSMDEYTEGGTPTTGAQVVYEITTPTTTATTPRVINANAGTTNIWADSGKIERAKYLTPLS